MATINYLDDVKGEHHFEMKPETLTAILNEYGNVEYYLITMGIYYTDCDYEY